MIVATLKNTTVNDTGYFQFPVGTTAQRPASPATGQSRINSDTNALEVYLNGAWTNAAIYGGDGTSAARAALSSVAIKQANPSATTGWYWLNLDGTARQYWVDMDYSGGGWVMVLSHYGGVAINAVTYSQSTTNYSYIGSSTLNIGSSNVYGFSFMAGLMAWDTIASRNNSGRYVVAMTATSGTGPTAAARRSRWTWSGWTASYQWSNPSGLTNEVGGTTPGLWSYHIAGNYGWSAYDQGVCSTQYGNAPLWYGACWDGNPWGGNGAGGHANNYFWTGSSGDYYAYGAIYVK